MNKGNLKDQVCIGVDIGGSHISCLGVDVGEKSILGDTLSRVSVSHEAHQDEILDAWASAIRKTIELIDQPVSGIGIAIPGPFDYRHGVSRMEHKFRSLKGVDIPVALKGRLADPGPDIRFLNDALAFAVGEAWIGAGREAERIIVLTLGTGFGSAYIDHGLPVIERAGVAPEGCFWHLPWEAGIADEYFSTRWFVQAYREMTGEFVTGVKTIADRAHEDAGARQVFEKFGRQLGIFLAPWIRKFHPGLLIIGGNIARALPLFKPSLSQTLDEADAGTGIRLSGLMENAAMVGAARLFDPAFWERYQDSDQPL